MALTTKIKRHNFEMNEIKVRIMYLFLKMCSVIDRQLTQFHYDLFFK